MVNTVTERIARLRERYLKSPAAKGDQPLHSAYGNHPMSLYWMEGYLEARGKALTTIERKSHAQAAELTRQKVVITDEELIVGQSDLKYTREEWSRYETLWEQYKMAPEINDDSRSDHTALNYEKLLKVGAEGLIHEIESQMAELTFSKETIREDLEKEEFYRSSLIELNALLKCAERYEIRLRELAEDAAPDRRNELLQMADNMRRVPRGPAETFWQALQSIHFYTFSLRGLYCAGRPDRLLLPYYRADIASGRITETFAQELIENYCLLYATYVTSNTAAGMMIGGTDADGSTVENELTWAFLKAVDHIRMADPNLGLCVTSKTSPELLRYAFDMIGRGCAFPSFWNDEAVAASLIRYGVDPKDAHMYINSTCVELSIIGKSNMWTTAPYHNLAQLLLDVFESGEYACYEDLEEAYFAHVRRAYAEENHRLNILKMERSRNASEPMLHSCLIDDCIARGRAVGNGGAVYNATLPNNLGMANAVDSLAAIRELVFRRKLLTLSEYRDAVKGNFEGFEALRRRILDRVPHYGNAVQEVDEIAVRLTRCIDEACQKEITREGAWLTPGIFSFFFHVTYGRNTPATPDGRLAGQPLADSAGPAQGRDTHSPTAAILSATSWDQCRFVGGVAQNIRLSAKYFSDSSMEAPIALLKGFFERNGCELQFNCVDRSVLEDAMLHPEDHEDLLVRIGGYCDFFVKQPESIQRDIIVRTDY